MRAQKNNIFSGMDLPLILLYLTLVLFGWMNIYAASISEEQTLILDFSTKYGKQLLWIGLSFVLILGILFIEARTYEKFASIIYIASLFSLFCLFIFGKKINGATSWYSFGSFSYNLLSSQKQRQH